MSLKRPAQDDGPASRPTKAPKAHVDGFPADYSKDVRKKIISSNRTGQACDRCRVRKMRCDDNPEGCSPCMQNQSACKTTDRITGRATVRGYVQNIERRLELLESHCHELEDRLISLGVDVEPSVQYRSQPNVQHQKFKEPRDQSPRPDWHDRAHLRNNGTRYSSVVFDSPRRLSQTDGSVSRLPDFRNGLTGENYLGVSSGNTLVSSIRGTSLNVLGMEIDLADYMHADLDEPDPSDYEKKPVYNKSYYAFILTAFSAKPKPQQIGLPSREEGMKCAEWFFKAVNPYLPVLHRPSFMKLFNRMYDDPSFEPSPAEEVTVHCVFAIMLWQFVVRNWENRVQQADFNRRSNLHYHYALGFFRQLMASHTLHDVQAMAMLCIHLRALPKPGACWMMTSTTLNLAIELGLHRSMRSWAPASRKISVLEIELRKRIFWSLLVVHIIISGKLGRPMALREEDYDVELPQAVDDNLLSEDGINTSKEGKCEFLVAMSSFEFEPICIDLYNNIYAVKRSPQTYIETVLRLESRIQRYVDSWDLDQLREWGAADDMTKVYPMYIRMWPLEFRLLLRHPSLSLTSSTEFNDESLSICMDISKQILSIIKQLQAWKSLDSNWQTGALFVLAVSTTLFGHWERRDQLTLAGFEELKEDMRAWLSIMGDMGRLLGSGRRLEQAVRVPVENTLLLLSRHLASKTASSALASTDHKLTPEPVPEQIQPGQVINEGFQTHLSYPKSTAQSTIPTPNGNRRRSYIPENGLPVQPVHRPQAFPPYTYPEPPPQQAPPPPQTYLSNPPPQGSAAFVLPHEPQNQTSSAPAYLYPSPAPQSAPAQQYHPQPPPPPNQNQNSTHPLFSAGIQAQWRHWAGSMAHNLEPQEYLSSANTLTQLGGNGDLPADAVGAGGGEAGVAAMDGVGSVAAGLSWPNGFFGPDGRGE
ncbi:MAG: hypothetical protein LQ343_003897 [Gyalolechia ehrenbergii]|nr:MAG: hypothetical protein LQ343_003897 [Gyalolechia ehrenbergii]